MPKIRLIENDTYFKFHKLREEKGLSEEELLSTLLGEPIEVAADPDEELVELYDDINREHTELVKEKIELLAEVERLNHLQKQAGEKFTEDHATIESLKDEIKELKSQLKEVKKERSKLKRELKKLTKQVQALTVVDDTEEEEEDIEDDGSEGTV